MALLKSVEVTSLYSLGLEFHLMCCKSLFLKKTLSQNNYFELLWVCFTRQGFVDVLLITEHS